MRIFALALIATLLAGGCMSRPARHDRSGEVSYNRREMPPEQGLFSGPDGEWTVEADTPPPDDSAPADEEPRTREEEDERRGDDERRGEDESRGDDERRGDDESRDAPADNR